MKKITSVNNDIVKETVKLQQKKYRIDKFLLEGDKPVREAVNAGINIDYVFVAEEKADEYAFLNDKIILTNDTVLKKISTTDTPPDIVGVGFKKSFDISVIKCARKVVLLDSIKDVGNLGTILRTSTAFGADAVILYGESADIYNPKCVRASVGNLWKLPVFEIKDLQVLKKYFSDFSRIATLPLSKNYLKSFTPSSEPILIMFGSEAEGLSNELINWATDSIKIEMSKDVESLNLSASCAIILYELFVNR